MLISVDQPPFCGIICARLNQAGYDGGSLSRAEVKFQRALSAAVEALFPGVSQRRSLELLGFVGIWLTGTECMQGVMIGP